MRAGSGLAGTSHTSAGGNCMERRRGAPRKRTLTRAKIVCADRRPTIDCTLHNLSRRGASLKVELTAGIPDQFTLIIEGGTVACLAQWYGACPSRWVFASPRPAMRLWHDLRLRLRQHGRPGPRHPARYAESGRVREGVPRQGGRGQRRPAPAQALDEEA